MRRRICTVLMAAALLAPLHPRPLRGQTNWPDTFWVPVTVYDYHADGSNPNFEPSGFSESYAGRRYNMIHQYLDADRKPIWSGINFTFNDLINEWWRPSGSGAEAVFQVTSTGRGVWSGLEPYMGRSGEFVGQSYSASDPMACVVVYDSLPFRLYDSLYDPLGSPPYNDSSLLGRGAYIYDDQAFFPIDGRGFGAEPATYEPYNWTNTDGHNYGFAVEIKGRFTYDSGERFAFSGDDDVWMFIDGQLMMDMGGIHGMMSDSVDVSAMGLSEGQVYTYDFFLCDRHVTGSHMRVLTTLVGPSECEGSLAHLSAPHSPVWVGERVDLGVTVWDCDSVPRPSWAAAASWQILSPVSSSALLTDVGALVEFDARDTGTFVVAVSACNPDNCEPTRASDTTVIFVEGPVPMRVELYPSIADTMVAGSRLGLQVEVWEMAEPGARRRCYEYEPQVLWTWEGAGLYAGSAEFAAPTGATNTFTATRAFCDYRVIASLVHPDDNTLALRDTLLVPVKPGSAAQLVIEADTVITPAELCEPNPLDLVLLDSTRSDRYAFAVARDAHGNFVRFADPASTVWSTVPAGIATAMGLPGQAHVGLIQPISDGSTVAIAQESSLLQDSVFVEVDCCPVPLRVRLVNLATGDSVAAVQLLAGDTIVLGLQWMQDDTLGVWSEGTGTWSLRSTTLSYDGAAPPSWGSSWVFRPTVCEQSDTLCVTAGASQVCVPVTTSICSSPTLASLTLLTPDSLRIAGDTLQVEVRISNLDGPVPGTYCFGPDTTPQVRYTDPLGPGANGQPAPVVVSGEGTATVNQFFSTGTSALTQCFTDGVDTVGLVLFFAPSTWEQHQLSAEFGSVTASTTPFLLRRGAAERLVLTIDDAGLIPAPDTLFLSDGDAMTLWATTTDSYGNASGPEDCRWSSSGGMPPAPQATASRMFVDAATFTGAAEGWVRAVSLDSSFADSVYVEVAGPFPRVVSGTTRDVSGNGLLDLIEVAMSGVVDLSAVPAAELCAGFTVEYYGDAWVVKGVVGRGGTMTDSVFELALVETPDGGPQSGMLPTLTVTGIDGIAAVVVPITSQDGAGPVIWEVSYLPSCLACENTQVTVTFSEEVVGTGLPLASMAPGQFLEALVATGDSVYEVTNALLSDISSLASVSDTTLQDQRVTVVSFTMENGICMSQRNGLRLDTTSAMCVVDAAVPTSNRPAANNRIAAAIQEAPCTNASSPGADTGCGNCGTGTEQALVPLFLFGGCAWRRRRRRRRRTRE